MSSVDDATATMIANFPAKTGRPLSEWVAVARASGLEKHGAIVAMLKLDHGMSHGFANFVAITALKPDDAPEGDALVDAIYSGKNAPLRDLHDQVLATVDRFGADVERAPKKTYVSLRRHKQFATVGPASGGRLEVGLNLPGTTANGRLEATTGMCTHRVRITEASELDAELVGWLREAYDRS